MPPDRQPGPAQRTGQAAISSFIPVPRRQRLEEVDTTTFRLTSEQQLVYDKVLSGEGVFVTGNAGTGKSYLLRAIIRGLSRKLGHANKLAITASTGVASLRIGGMTLHSWAGLSGTERSVDDMIKKIKRNPFAQARWFETESLLIDEVGMITANFLDRLEAVARVIRESPSTFGGIQVITFGDFLQLPPVMEYTDKFTYRAACWNKLFPHKARLTTSHRQADPEFAAALNRCRTGELDEKTVAFFKALDRPIADTYMPELDAVFLFPTRLAVKERNSTRLRQLNGTSYHFTAIDNDKRHPSVQKKISLEFPVDASIELKVGAQVMLLQNIGDGLANGSTGTVVGFYRSGQVDRHSPGRKAGYLRGVRVNDANYPLDCYYTSMDDLRDTTYCFPLIKFSTSEGPECVLVMPVEFPLKVYDKTIATRLQLPIALSWAITIHKSQSQTLDKVIIDLDRTFTAGQAYVALSRARSKDGLEVRNFSSQKVKVDNKALHWYNTAFEKT